jgi:hypothetical protein
MAERTLKIEVGLPVTVCAEAVRDLFHQLGWETVEDVAGSITGKEPMTLWNPKPTTVTAELRPLDQKETTITLVGSQFGLGPLMNSAVDKRLREFKGQLDPYLAHGYAETKQKISEGLVCPQCFGPVKAGERFCPRDGTPVARVCQHCNHPNPPKNEYCTNCGKMME